MKSVLAVAYYFPPAGGVGVQRTLKLMKYLPERGWSPIVLTVDSPPGMLMDPGLSTQVPASAKIYHAGSRTIPTWLPWRVRSWIARWFLVDEQQAWISPAVKAGLQVVHKEPVSLLYSTSGPYTDHLVANEIHTRTRLPWIVDFRDPWVDNLSSRYPTSLHKNRVERLERKVITQACRVLAVTEFHRDQLISRYPDLDSQKFIFLPNGFDPADFAALQPAVRPSDCFLVVYTGSFYQRGRTADPFLDALHQLIRAGELPPDKIRVWFIGNTGQSLIERVKSLHLEKVVETIGFRPHAECLSNLLSADLLLLIGNTGPGSEGVYTGKLFEYLAARKPILALAPPGAAANLVQEAQAGFVVDPEDVSSIASKLVELFHLWQQGKLSCTSRDEVIARFDRRKQAERLARLFDECISPSQESSS